jgi:protein-tyrosine phosphatase
MELLSTAGPDSVIAYVEIVPGRLYWAAVDLDGFFTVVKNTSNCTLVKPLKKETVKVKNLQKRHSSSPTDTEDNPTKVRRTASQHRVPVKSNVRTKVVYTDKVLKYHPLANDFGPLDLPSTLRYIEFMDARSDSSTILVHVSDYRAPQLCANSACLIAIYASIRCDLTPAQIWGKFHTVPRTLIPPFRDASSAVVPTYTLSLKDCCEAFQLGLTHNWIDWENFDVAQAETLQTVEHGDMNWIIDGKFIAFAGPSTNCEDEDGLDVLPVSHYVPIFQAIGVTDIVRLNIRNYHPDEFTEHGFVHHELFFEDGSCPSMDIVNSFLRAADSATGAIAVHCKAGLGRTVTLIGAHVMKQYKVPARQFIAWARIVRPGSVIGPQQHFLEELEARFSHHHISSKSASSGSQSLIGKLGEKGQARMLLHKKRGRDHDTGVTVV